MPSSKPISKILVFKGVPEVYDDLYLAEERAETLVERDQLDYTVMAVPEDSVTEKSLVFRYVGVQCMTLQEARKQEGE